MSVDQAQILQSIQAAFEHVQPEGASPRTLNPDDVLAELGVSSIAALEMAAFLEDRFDIDLPDDQLAQLTTVGALADLIQTSSNQQE